MQLWLNHWAVKCQMGPKSGTCLERNAQKLKKKKNMIFLLSFIFYVCRKCFFCYDPQGPFQNESRTHFYVSVG